VRWLQKISYFALFLDKVKKTLCSSQHSYLISFAHRTGEIRSQSGVKNRLLHLQARIKAAGRPVRLVVVTKYQPIETILELYHLGLRECGESKVVDALKKIEALPQDISWHFIGTLQKNKVNKVIGKFSLIHSVDSVELAKKISAAALRERTPTRILLQVNPLQELTKHGFSLEEFEGAYTQIKELPNIEVKGLMVMAPKGDELLIRRAFSLTAKLFDRFRCPTFSELSMGMSQDFELAIEYGATIVRVGSVLFTQTP
jgi:pyridoxal phosphate enzyme (YggS family)